MSHVDEGLLHAWIDGAFTPGDAEGDAIGAHIAACAECAVRAAEARRLKERAGAVLQQVAPDAVRVEPFERMISARRAQANAVAQRPRRRAAVPLAWAASIMLAITAGWMARAYLPIADAPAREALESEAFAPAQAPQTVAGVDEAGRDPDAATRDRAGDTAATRVSGASGQTAAPGERAANEAQGQTVAGRAAGGLADAERRDEARRLSVAQEAAPPPPAAARPVDALGRALRSDSEQARVREEDAAKAVSPDAPAVYRFADATDWREVSMNDAAMLLGRAPLRIDTLGIDALHASAAEGIVRLRQTTAPGIGVDLFQQRAAAVVDQRAQVTAQSAALRGLAAAAEPTSLLTAGDTPAITLERSGIVLVIRAPMTVDSLRALLARIR